MCSSGVGAGGLGHLDLLPIGPDDDSGRLRAPAEQLDFTGRDPVVVKIDDLPVYSLGWLTIPVAVGFWLGSRGSLPPEESGKSACCGRAKGGGSDELSACVHDGWAGEVRGLGFIGSPPGRDCCGCGEALEPYRDRARSRGLVAGRSVRSHDLKTSAIQKNAKYPTVSMSTKTIEY